MNLSRVVRFDSHGPFALELLEDGTFRLRLSRFGLTTRGDWQLNDVRKMLDWFTGVMRQRGFYQCREEEDNYELRWEFIRSDGNARAEDLWQNLEQEAATTSGATTVIIEEILGG